MAAATAKAKANKEGSEQEEKGNEDQGKKAKILKAILNKRQDFCGVVDSWIVKLGLFLLKLVLKILIL